MAYTKQNFIKGQTLKAEHLNTMEEGIKEASERVDLLEQAKESGEFDGVSVTSITQTMSSSADGGTNVITAILSDGTISTFNIKNGSKGSSPVRGTDYWTDADKAEIKSYVDEAILGGTW